MLDTNILISFALFPSPGMTKLAQTITTQHSACICEYSIMEMDRVVRRKFPDKRQQAERFLLKFPYSLLHTPTVRIADTAFTIRDEDDYPVLLSAVLADVDILITGDKDFDDVSLERPEILTPAAFMERYG
ncbi:MAG: putative toxin-antitoxin system toxin component, PIN family [Oscillospiraceae bacterium]|jgi:putative PIN family toxin of toxin-antitoxin system|nr:putative toxin-antitoxin system toxin component, PIN family [Oscillospiraceae bacterium]